jgi:hypothetical protein
MSKNPADAVPKATPRSTTSRRLPLLLRIIPSRSKLTFKNTRQLHHIICVVDNLHELVSEDRDGFSTDSVWFTIHSHPSVFIQCPAALSS